MVSGRATIGARDKRHGAVTFAIMALVSEEARPCVLIVDDEEEVLEAIGRYLGRRQLQVITASSPFEVARLAFLNKPVLIVLDVMMPGLDGEQVSRFLRRTPEVRETPIVFYSAADEDELRRIAATNDATYVTKTGGFSTLYTEIARILGRPPSGDGS